MLQTIAIVLLVLWLLGVVSDQLLGDFIHVLLVVAFVLVPVRISAGRKPLRPRHAPVDGRHAPVGRTAARSTVARSSGRETPSTRAQPANPGGAFARQPPPC